MSIFVCNCFLPSHRIVGKVQVSKESWKRGYVPEILDGSQLNFLTGQIYHRLISYITVNKEIMAVHHLQPNSQCSFLVTFTRRQEVLGTKLHITKVYYHANLFWISSRYITMHNSFNQISRIMCKFKPIIWFHKTCFDNNYFIHFTWHYKKLKTIYSLYKMIFIHSRCQQA